MTCLDWSDAAHWSNRRRPCRHCGAPTNLLDAAGRPAHKVCCERVIDQLRTARANQRKEVA
jgi:hypothetical protein